MNRNSSAVIKSLNDELRALKAVYALGASQITLYEYSVTAPATGYHDHEVTFQTEDNSDAIATIANVDCRRVPFSGGAKWKVSYVYNQNIIVRSMQKGTLTLV